MTAEEKPSALEFTGERVVPGKTPAFLVLEHMLRYRFAARLAGGKRVLDAGCGTGYGAALLAEQARHPSTSLRAGGGQARQVVGIDFAEDAVQYARENYARANVQFARADCRRLAFANGSFDLVVLFEVLEHVSGQDECLDEIRRVLRADGVLMLSTPNAARATKAIEEENPFHCKELTEAELTELLRRHFRHVQVLYQHETSGTAIETHDASGSSEVAEDSAGSQVPKYLIAACGARPFTLPNGGMASLGGIDHQIAIVRNLHELQAELLAHRREIETLQEELKSSRLGIEALEKEIASLREGIRSQADAIKGLDEEIETRGKVIESQQKAMEALLVQREQIARDYAENLAAHQQVIQKQETQIAERERKLDALGRENDARQAELDWLYKWIPTNKLARKFLYGRNLRRRLIDRFGVRK